MFLKCVFISIRSHQSASVCMYFSFFNQFSLFYPLIHCHVYVFIVHFLARCRALTKTIKHLQARRKHKNKCMWVLLTDVRSLMLRGWRCRAVTNRGYCSLIRASRPHTHAYRQVLMLMLHSLSLTQAAERSGSRIKCSDSDSDAPECWALLDIADTYTHLHTYICMHTNIQINERTNVYLLRTSAYACIYRNTYIDTCV